MAAMAAVVVYEGEAQDGETAAGGGGGGGGRTDGRAGGRAGERADWLDGRRDEGTEATADWHERSTDKRRREKT